MVSSMKISVGWIPVFAIILFCNLYAAAQSVTNKPLLIVKVDSENANFTQPAAISPVDGAEIREIRVLLVRQLSKTFTIIPESDKRDCIELGLVLERLHAGGGSYYVGSSVISVGKGENDLLVTHNPVVEPTLDKVSAAIVFQLSMMQLQAYFPTARPSNH